MVWDDQHSQEKSSTTESQGKIDSKAVEEGKLFQKDWKPHIQIVISNYL